MAALPPAINGTEQRLDAILAELRALRADLQRLVAPGAVVGTGEVVELREPQRRKRG